jgi:pSer/pThr/pTyr-binding forkhead associated (FHA) protein
MYAIKLTFMSGPDDGLVFWVKSNQGRGHAVVNGWEFSIGRREECDIRILYDTQVSREHAALYIGTEGLRLNDLKSRNGCYIGERRIEEPTPLQTNELFRVGHTWMRVEEYQR